MKNKWKLKANLKKWFKEEKAKEQELIRFKAEARKNAFRDYYGFRSALRAKGFEEIGSGYYSSVFHKPGSKRVLKLLHNPQRDGWVPFIRWAHKNGFDGNLTPKVYSYKFLKSKKGDGGFAIASIEKLDKTLSQVDKKHKVAFIGAVMPLAIKFKNEAAVKVVNDALPGVDRFIDKFEKDFRGAGIDLHDENFMMRADGSLVITDPISRPPEENKDYKERFHSAPVVQ